MRDSFIIDLEKTLCANFGQNFKILDFSPLMGGDINEAFKLETNEGYFFVKKNEHPRAIQMFESEARGLALLSNTLGDEYVAQVVHYGKLNSCSFLLLEWIDVEDKQHRNCQRIPGRNLAKQHRQAAIKFGLDHDNFIGLLPQRNSAKANWTDFFITERLQTQLVRTEPDFHRRLQPHFDRLYLRIPELYPTEPPSLLHGDLWSGNYLSAGSERPVFIDPAVYYGHREMDIAMSKLFGGFSDDFYAAYGECYPLVSGWEGRSDLWNLYPLLVHLNLFGGSYLQPILSKLSGLGC